MSGGGLFTLGKAYELFTGDDKYEDAWRKPVSTLTGHADDAPPPLPKPGTDPAIDEKAQADREEEIRKRLRMSEGGRASTILTSGMDKMGGSSTKKVLFGE